MPPTTRHTTSAINDRIDDHEQRIDDLERRLAKYDAIIVRLDTLIDVLTRRVEDTANKAEDAIEGQEIIQERNETAHRWSAASIAIATSLIVGVLCFILGYVLH